MLATIRHELAVGEYTKAHQDLAMAAQHDDQSTQAERREVKDNLCLTEYVIGQGSYPMPEQHRARSDALAEPRSLSGAILARVHDSLKQSAGEEVDARLKPKTSQGRRRGSWHTGLRPERTLNSWPGGPMTSGKL